MRKLLAVVALLLFFVAPMTAAAAYNPLDSACSAGSNTSSVCEGGHGVSADPNKTLRSATTLIAIIAGLAAVIVIIISGLLFVLSGGDAQKAASARSALIGAVVGLAIIVVAQSIVLFVLGKV